MIKTALRFDLLKYLSTEVDTGDLSAFSTPPKSYWGRVSPQISSTLNVSEHRTRAQ
mgnify:FL=1